MDISEVNALLGRLSITPRYVGCPYVADAVYLAVGQPELLLHVTKDLYPAVASHFNTTCACVMRNIRTVIDVVWTVKRSALRELAPHPLVEKPTVSQFIAILAAQFMF